MNKKVTYSDIVNALSKKTGFGKQKTEDFVKALLNEVKDELKDSGKASITNFGSFKVKDVAEREGKNPQTGDPITIPAHKRVSFSPYKSLREDVNTEYGHLESKLIEDEESTSEEESAEIESWAKGDEEKADDKSPVEAETHEQNPEDESEEESELNSEEESSIDSEETEEEEVPEVEEEKDEELESEVVVAEPPKEEEKNYTNLLASLAILLMTIIAITSVWFLLENGKKSNNVAQNNVQAGSAVDGQQVAQTQPARNVESIKNEADELEKRLNALVKQEERLRAQENERVERLAAARGSSYNNGSSVENDSNTSTSASGDQAITQNYQVQEGDWYWAISEKIYGKSRFWPLLFKENRSVSEDPDKLFKQINIKVPDMDGTAENPTKQDYKELAAASKMVAQAYENAGKTEKANEYAKFAQLWEKLGA
jgi:DNA-binding protein HU-beta